MKLLGPAALWLVGVDSPANGGGNHRTAPQKLRTKAAVECSIIVDTGILQK